MEQMRNPETDLSDLLTNLSLNPKVGQNGGSGSSQSSEDVKKTRKISYIANRVDTDTSSTGPKENISVRLLRDSSRFSDWNIKFDGVKMSVSEFIDLMSEKKKSANISDEEILQVIPNVLTGHPLQWYNLHIKKFYTWQDFVVNIWHAYRNPSRLPPLEKPNKKVKRVNVPKAVKTV